MHKLERPGPLEAGVGDVGQGDGDRQLLPAEAELEFTVVITGEGLLGDDSVRVEGKGSTSYELLFSPLVAGTTRGQATSTAST